MMLNMVILVLMLNPLTGRYLMVEVALPAGSPLVACESAQAQVEAMLAAEEATRWYAMAARCSARART